MPKPLLPVETILDKALEILDESGIEGLSARNLAAALKCSTRTLYQQVGKRDELVGKLFAYHFAAQQLQFNPCETWQETSYAWAIALREALLAHPNLSRLISADHRAPIADYTSGLLRFLVQAGFPQEMALRSCRVLVNVSLSLTLSELATPDDYQQRKRRSHKEIQFEDLVVKRGGTDPDGKAPEVFSSSLSWIISGIERELGTRLEPQL